MQILINALDKIKKEISSTSSLYDRGWNDALEKAKECFTSYNPVIEWIPTELMLPPEPDEDVDIEELPQYTVTIKNRIQYRNFFHYWIPFRYTIVSN